jgi:hypothetical protein
MKNNVMENMDLMGDDQDLLEMIDNFFTRLFIYKNLKLKTYRFEDDSSLSIVLFEDGDTPTFYLNKKPFL